MKISVITVTYNCSRVIEDCLSFVAEQIYGDVEHVAIDGASTDGTLDILRAHRSKLSVLVSEPDGGIYDAMNKGIAHAHGEILGFLNADDIYVDDRVLQTVAQCFSDDPNSTPVIPI